MRQLCGVDSDQLVKAKKRGVLNMSPADDVEGEIIYLQNKLLDIAVSRKRQTGLFPYYLNFNSYACPPSDVGLSYPVPLTC